MEVVERVKLKDEKHGRKLSTLHFQFSIQNIVEYIEFCGRARQNMADGVIGKAQDTGRRRRKLLDIAPPEYSTHNSKNEFRFQRLIPGHR